MPFRSPSAMNVDPLDALWVRQGVERTSSRARGGARFFARLCSSGPGSKDQPRPMRTHRSRRSEKGNGRTTARVVALALVLALATACGSTVPSASRRDPHTVAALLKIARRFNANYSANRDGATYDRFDAASRAVIGRAEYVRRHKECPDAPGPSIVLGATRVAGGYWAVRYSISGTPLTDYWHYVGGHWRFSLVRSNPGAVTLYRLPAHRYFVALGCVPAR